MNQTPAIRPILTDDYLLALIAVQKASRSPAQLLASAKMVMSKAELQAALERMAAAGHATPGPAIQLTVDGRRKADLHFGALAGKDGKFLASRVFPALALGLRPDSAGGKRIGAGNLLRAVLLVRIYQLPVDVDKVTLVQAIASLAKRGLAGGAPPRADDRIAALAAGIDDYGSPEGLRKALLKLAVESGRAQRQGEDGRFEAGTGTAPSPGDDKVSGAGASKVSVSGDGKVSDARDGKAADAVEEIRVFAKRVQSIVTSISTPPFTHKTAIAQAYDAYGRQFDDAGSLQSFHQRLLAGRRAGLIRLLPLDQPGALPAQVLQRSQIETPDGPVVFIAREAA